MGSIYDPIVLRNVELKLKFDDRLREEKLRE